MSEIKEDLLDSSSILNCIDDTAKQVIGRELSETEFDDIISKLEEEFPAWLAAQIKSYFM